MDRDEKLAAIGRSGPFALLDPVARQDLAERMTVRSLRFGQTVFEKGDPGDAMYIIASGKARVLGSTPGGQETTLAVLGPGAYFGEAALTSGAPRNAGVRAAFDLTLLRLERSDFERMLARHPDVLGALRRFLAVEGIQNFLKESTALEVLPAHVLCELIGEFEELHFKMGDAVIREGDEADRFYVVYRGMLEAIYANGQEGTAATHVLGQIGEGEFFGEVALLRGCARTATVIAASDCVVYALSRNGFERAVAASPQFRARLEQRIAQYHGDGDAAAGEIKPLVPPAEARAAGAEEDEQAEDRVPEEELPPPAPGGWLRRLPLLGRIRRRPYISQRDASDCGAACLAMCCAHYGVRVGLSRVRDMANVDADGATLWSVARAAEGLGFRARGLQLGFDALPELTLPAIAHWEGVHYIVLYEANPNGVLVADPGLSLIRMTREQFERGWTGRLLELTPTPQLRGVPPARTAYQRFWPIIRPYLPLLGEVLVASLLLSILGLGVPVFTQMIVDRVLVSQSPGLLNMLLIAMLLIAGFQAALTTVRRVLLVHVSIRADAELVSQFLGHVMKLPMRFFDLRRVGDIISRLQENEKLRTAMVGTIPGVLLDCVLAIGYVGLMFYYSARLTLMVVAILPMFVILIIALTPAMRRNRREHSAREADAWSQFIEAITGIGTVKAMASEPSVRWRAEGLYIESLLAARKGAHLQTVYLAASLFLQTATTALLLWYGARQVLQGVMTIGELLAFVTLTAQIIQPTIRLVEAWEQLQDVRNAVERLNDVLDARPERPAGRTFISPRKLTGAITLESVTFRYSMGQEKPSLANFTLQVQPGEHLAVVGRSGSGKSTLGKLMLGLYTPTEGRILIDGHDVRLLSPQALRRRIGVVPQDVFLFSGSARENISAGDPDTPLERIVRAAQLAGAHDFIAANPLGYDMKVGERGMSLSGGQRQRIALARALLHDPDVLVLDEATSSLDAESERTIQRSLEAAAQSRTTIVIAHRLSTVRNADRIIVLDGGCLVEQGTHEELIGRGGLYASLVGQQVQE